MHLLICEIETEVELNETLGPFVHQIECKLQAARANSLLCRLVLELIRQLLSCETHVERLHGQKSTLTELCLCFFFCFPTNHIIDASADLRSSATQGHAEPPVEMNCAAPYFENRYTPTIHRIHVTANSKAKVKSMDAFRRNFNNPYADSGSLMPANYIQYNVLRSLFLLLLL